MADQETSALCEAIIEAHFGPLTSKVTATLLARGRLPFSQLARYTSLKPRVLAQSLLVLIQHNLVWHSQDSDAGAEIFEFDWQETLTRLRFGRFIGIVRDVIGEEAAEIVSHILDHGKLRLPDIIDLLNVKGNDEKTKSYTNTLNTLLSDSYLKPCTVISHTSPNDRLIRYVAEETAKIKGIPAAKDIKEARVVAGIRLSADEKIVNYLKRKAPDTNKNSRTPKRQKLEEEIDPDLHFRVNAPKFHVHIRNYLMQNAALQRYNSFAGAVIDAALQGTLSSQENTTKSIRSDPISTTTVSSHLPPSLNLTGICDTNSSSSHQLKEYLNVLCAADNPSETGRKNAFMAWVGGKISVEFELVAKKLRLGVLEGFVRERWGDVGVRIVRVLLDKGKMDEKHIGKICMMAKKDVQPLLTALSSASIIALQEVPKSADRNPARTFYLWYVDLPKAYSHLVSHLHKTLFNILTRIVSETTTGPVSHALMRAERTDVQASDSALLDQADREILKEWGEKRERLLGLLGRVEECAFILRELGSWKED